MFVHKVGMCFSDTQRNPLKNNFSGNVFSQGGNGPLKHKGILSLSKQRQIFSAHLVTRWEQALTTQRKPLKKKFLRVHICSEWGNSHLRHKGILSIFFSRGTCLFRMWEQAFKTQKGILSKTDNFSGHVFVLQVWMGPQTHKGILSKTNSQGMCLFRRCEQASRHTKECSHLCVLRLVQKLQRGLQQGLDLRDVSRVVVLQTQFACHPVQKHGHRDGEGGDAFVGVWVAAKCGQVVQLDQVEPLAWKIIILHVNSNSLAKQQIIIIMEICKAPTLWLKALSNIIQHT